MRSVSSVVLVAVMAFAGLSVLEVRSDDAPSVTAAPLPNPDCQAGYGSAGQTGMTQAATVGGNGCVVVSYVIDGTAYYETFNYTGVTQSALVPAGVDIVTVSAYGAGGGGTNTGPVRTNATNSASWYSDASVSALSMNGGGAGGSATGTFVVTPGETLSVVVGQGGIGNPDTRCLPTVTRHFVDPDTGWEIFRNTDLNEARASFGGGARAKTHYNTRAFWPVPPPLRDDDECINPYFASGGGRSEVLRGTSRLVGAGGGGGAGFFGVGGDGGILAVSSIATAGSNGDGPPSVTNHSVPTTVTPSYGSGGTGTAGGAAGLTSRPLDNYTGNTEFGWVPGLLLRVNGRVGVAGSGGDSREGGGGGGGGCFGGGGGGDGGGGGGGSSCLLGSVISRFTTTSPDATYVAGESVDITAVMSKPIADGAVITVTLDTGETVTLTKTGPYTMSGSYVVGANATSADLTVLSYSLTTAPVDVDGITMTSTAVPSGAFNIAGAHAIVIGAAQPNPAPVAPDPVAPDPVAPDPVGSDSDLLDPDTLAVSEVTVFEDAGWAEFEVTGPPAMEVLLVVESGTATIGADFGDELQVFDGRSWGAYETGSYVSLDEAGILLVRVPIIVDDLAEGMETFRLIAISETDRRAEGIGRILDSGYLLPSVADTAVGTPLNTPYSGNVLRSAVGMGLEVIGFSVEGVDGVFAAGEVITLAGVGSLVINADGSYEFIPALGFVGDVPAVTFTVQDSFGLTASGMLSIGVGSVLPRTGAELWEFALLGLLLALLGVLTTSRRFEDPRDRMTYCDISNR